VDTVLQRRLAAMISSWTASVGSNASPNERTRHAYSCESRSQRRARVPATRVGRRAGCADLSGIVEQATLSFWSRVLCRWGDGSSSEGDDLYEVVETSEIVGISCVERKVRSARGSSDQKVDCSGSARLSTGGNDG